MQIFHFKSNKGLELIESITDAGDGYYWLDVERSELDWYEKASPWLGLKLHERHLMDTFSISHPPYYDSTLSYDLLVVRTLCPECPLEAPTTQPVALVLTPGFIVSVRPPGNPIFMDLQQRLMQKERKQPSNVGMLLYLMLDQVTDGLMARRDQLTELLSGWQDRLLDKNDKFNDWQALMRLRSYLRRMEVITESQLDAIDTWRDETAISLTDSLPVRFNDLQEHLRRVYNHAIVLQQDIDALTQIYFSAGTQRTNEILQFLAVISAIFLPLNLLAGVFGMNFKHMPLLDAVYGPWLAGAIMVSVIIGLVYLFKLRKWI